jgi:uncharacterized protein YndB with AHSA1/START domain
MPSFNDTITAAAPPEEVWKILYDPSRFPEWWAGIETTETEGASGAADGQATYIMYPTGYPDFPMPQLLETVQAQQRVVVSCLVSDLRFEWTLEPLDGGVATRISVHVDIPPDEAHRLDTQRAVIGTSLTQIARLAANGC